MQQDRRLAAIMFTDIRGYTALMQKSEAAAIELRNRHREIFERITQKHLGNIVQYYGDGTLSTFESALNAVHCGVELQKAFRSDPGIPVRIGIHIGDIVITETDIIGDAVNLASRVESLGVAGSVLVSEKVVVELKNQAHIQTKTLGKFHFKNDARAREIFAIVDPNLVIPKRSQMKGKTVEGKPFVRALITYLGAAWVLIQIFNFFLNQHNGDEGFLDLLIIFGLFGIPAILIHSLIKPRLSWKSVLLHGLNFLVALLAGLSYMLNPIRFEPSQIGVLNLFDQRHVEHPEDLYSIAVLPFSNFTGDNDQDFLYAGMHDGLISEINQLSSVRSISRTSTLAYQNTRKSVRKIAKELGVDALMEASISRMDTNIELRIKLINVFPEEQSLWTHTFQTSLGDLPNTYKAVTQEIASKINASILPLEQQRLSTSSRTKSAAYEAYLKGTYYSGFLTAESFDIAEGYFYRAISIDPEFSLGHSGLALVMVSKKQMGLVSTAEANPKILEYHGKAMQLDSTDSDNWIGEGAIRTWTQYDWPGGEKAFLKSISMNPYKAESRTTYAHLLMILGRIKEARIQMDQAESLDPLNPWTLSFSAVLYVSEGKMIQASKQFERLKRLEPNHPMLGAYLFNKYMGTFQYDLAIEELKKLIQVEGKEDIYELIDVTYREQDFLTTIKTTAKALEELSTRTFVPPLTILRLYEAMGDGEKRLFWMKKLYEVRDPNLPYYAIRTQDPLQQDPRYKQIMVDIGLW